MGNFINLRKWRQFIHFVAIGGYGICIVGLRGYGRHWPTAIRMGLSEYSVQTECRLERHFRRCKDLADVIAFAPLLLFRLTQRIVIGFSPLSPK